MPSVEFGSSPLSKPRPGLMEIFVVKNQLVMCSSLIFVFGDIQSNLQKDHYDNPLPLLTERHRSTNKSNRTEYITCRIMNKSVGPVNLSPSSPSRGLSNPLG